MTAETADASPPPAGAATSGALVARHRLVVRITHWINVLALLALLTSGLQIFNAHPALYWGSASTFDRPWLEIRAEQIGGRAFGVTTIGEMRINTTGVLGYSPRGGAWENRAFPDWITLPPYRSLAKGRNWHFFFAWVFAINGLVYLGSGLINRHLTRDVLPSGKDLRTLHKDPHLRLKFSRGPDAARYHQVQRVAYSSVVFILLPLVALTGMTMSPGLNAAFPFLLDIFGGRQSARSIHFICAILIVGFFLIHILMVILAGPLNQLRGMITGKFAIGEEENS
jgi:thiosulfate reductase cytochrome b subunit